MLLKKKITSKRGALKYSSELADSVRIYSALINTDHEFWADYPQSAASSVATLNLLGMTQIRPLLLAILRKFKANDSADSLHKLVSVAVRYQLVGGVGGGTLEKLYSETAKAVSEGKISTPKGIVQELKTVPSDNAFLAAFTYATVSKQKIARYFLRELEIAKSQRDSETIPDSDPNNVNLEHVLPIIVTDDWKHFDEDEWRTYHRRLGNMAVMASRTNSSLGNCDFATKKLAFKESKFYFTSQLASIETWNKKAIEARQKEMAELAVKHWKP